MSRRPWEAEAYGNGPVADCWWAQTVPTPGWGSLEGDHDTDVAIIGGGFTGMSAAYHLARSGVDVTLLEGQSPLWGASGRNGGFCCLGGAKMSERSIRRRVGETGHQEWRRAEAVAVNLVDELIGKLALDVDRHSNGETLLAHRPADWPRLEAEVEDIRRDYGVEARLIPKQDLDQHGMAGPFHGALTTPIGFGLNPRKYLSGLAQAAQDAGARLHDHSHVDHIEGNGTYVLRTARGSLRANRLIVATGGYSSDDLPGWLAARFMPLQSSVIVTRPLTPAELENAGWTTDQMCYDTRHLLHYFRRMPDGRFLFGMRGGLAQTPQATAANQRAILRDFHQMFPAWRDVEVTNYWSGLVCFTRHRAPYVGAIPSMPNAFTGYAYHGNGVAMGTYAGALLAQAVTGENRFTHPRLMRVTPRRFPFGRFRRAPMRAVYAAHAFLDRG